MQLGIYSTMSGMPWGGSEELWSRAATVMLQQGHQVSVNYKRRRQRVEQIEALRTAGADIHLRSGIRTGRTLRRVLGYAGFGRNPGFRWLKASRPDFVLISLGLHLDETAITQTLRAAGIPYGILVQAASPYQWHDANRYRIERAAFAGATRCFFVSRQNREIVETNLALDLSESPIVDNPFQVDVNAAPAWPKCDTVWKLACVARVSFQAKAQDLLLRVMRQPKWRSRPIQIHLWGGDGGSMEQTQALISLHNQQKQIFLHGFDGNVETIWSNHHALVLPSRFEGNSLAMIEAMMCGRVPIVTNVGRVDELVDDNVNGFVAASATPALLDEALERAWQRRHEWQSMGQLAGEAIRRRHSLKPAEDFAASLLDAATGQRQPKSRAAA